jgi:hypothetical protein
MDAILKSFSISFLLRSFFAGVFFVFSYRVAEEGLKNALEINSKDIFSIGLPFALVAGVTVYGIHRSLIYPIIEWFFNCTKNVRQKERTMWIKEKKFRWTLISQNTIDNLVERWDRRAKEGEEKRFREEQNSIWADYIHLQYTSSLCIFFGSWSAIIANDHCIGSINWPMFLLAVLLFVGGFISNWRSRSVEEHRPNIKSIPTVPNT